MNVKYILKIFFGQQIAQVHVCQKVKFSIFKNPIGKWLERRSFPPQRVLGEMPSSCENTNFNKSHRKMHCYAFTDGPVHVATWLKPTLQWWRCELHVAGPYPFSH